MGVLILDGRRVAADRLPGLQERARAVQADRGRPPRLLILAFADDEGRVPWVEAKARAAQSAGVEVRSLLLPPGIGTAAAVADFREAVVRHAADGVFVQFPFPAGVDGDALSAVIPRAADVDVMHPEGVRRYLAGEGDSPPVTVTAALTLLDAYGIGVQGRRCRIVVGEPSDFERMLRAAVVRRGGEVRIEPLAGDDLAHRLADGEVVITSVGRPGAVAASALPQGAIVIDGGYFNPGPRGDVAIGDGVDHLGALAPVPGGIGPLTVSALLEAVVVRAEAGRPPAA